MPIDHASLTTPNIVSLESDEVVEHEGKTFEGFYISYNDTDEAIYGSDTTALVLSQGLRFYILNGDHRAAYRERMAQGFAACLAYFQESADQMNPYSDPL